MTQPPRALLLDTHAAIWLVEGMLDERTVEVIASAGLADGVYVSPVSAWEIGLLARARPGRPAVQFHPDPSLWFAALMSKPTIRPAPFTPAIAISSSFLPGVFHNDPADRLLVATARELDCPLMTRDREILGYAGQGHLAVVPC